MSTPTRGSSAYFRIWENVPSSKRIIEDTGKFLHAIEVIAKNNGKAVAGLGTRKGNRNCEAIRSLKKRGGLQVKLEGQYNRWIHEDAVKSMHECIASSVATHKLVKMEGEKYKDRDGDTRENIGSKELFVSNSGYSEKTDGNLSQKSSTSSTDSSTNTTDVPEFTVFDVDKEIYSTRPCNNWEEFI